MRDYQQEAIEELKDGIRAGHLRQVLQLPTGAGKTKIASQICLSAKEKGKLPFFIVPLLTLIDQAVAAFREEGLRVGVIQGNHPEADPKADVQVCSIQTLNRRSGHQIDLGIVDEIHVLYKAHVRLLERFDNVPWVGLSATPFRRGLGTYFSRLVVGSTTSELIEQGWLVAPQIYRYVSPDLSGVRTQAGDYVVSDLEERCNQPKLVGNITKTWLKYAQDRQTLVFCVNIKHSKSLTSQFASQGVRAVHIDAYSDSTERRQAIEGFKTGRVQMLCSVGVLTMGFDAPNASCLVLARPTKSLMLHIQQIGRGLRTAPGKINCLVLDHAGNTTRLGLPTDPLPDVLDDGKPPKEAGNSDTDVRTRRGLPAVCPSCCLVLPKDSTKCPSCDSTIELQKFELQPEKYSWQEKQRWYSMLKCYATRFGKKKGWISHTYRAKFGVWPNMNYLRDVPLETDSEVSGYIRHRNIAYRKRMQKA